MSGFSRKPDIFSHLLRYDDRMTRTSTPQQHRLPARWIWLVGDVIALGLFVLLGERDHAINDAQPVMRWLLTTGYFLVPWLIIAWLVGAYPHEDELPLRTLLARTLNAWWVAAPLGALLRSLVLGTGVILSPFLLVTLGIGSAFLLGWRTALILLRQMRKYN
jgi:hypothetical protein